MKKLSIHRKRIFWHFLLLFLSINIFQFSEAQCFFLINDSLQKAMNCVYEFRYNDAKKIIAQERKTNTKNVASDFIESTMYAFQANFNDNPKYFEQLKSIKSRYVNQINQLPEDQPWRQNLLAQMHIQSTFVHLKYEEYYTAFKELRSANKLLKINKKKKPNFFPDLLPSGMLSVIVSSIPDNIRWIAETFGLTGNYETGMSNMETVLETSYQTSEYQWLEYQSLIFIAMVQMSLGDNPEQNKQFKNILEQRFENIKNSPILVHTLATLNVKTGNNDRAIELLEMILQKKQSAEYPTLYYQLGRCKLQRMDFDAEQPFNSYLTHYKYNKFVKASYQQIAWSYYLKGDLEQYFENIKKVFNHGDTKSGADKEANNEYQRHTPPNKDLLKARLYFDGGYLDQAFDVLQNANQAKFTKAEKLEYIYRYGRIYHGKNNYNQAITYYKKVLEEGKNSTAYLVANSALMLGNIYEQQRNFQQALIYYEKCQSLKSDEYESSIHQKAKIGENRCKQHIN